MPKFIVLYRSPFPAADMLKSVTPEQMQEGMKLWQTWVEKCGESLVEMGSPMGQGVSVGRSGNSPTTDRGGVNGYSIIHADTLDDALTLLEGHPHPPGRPPQPRLARRLPHRPPGTPGDVAPALLPLAPIPFSHISSRQSRRVCFRDALP